MNKPPPAGLKMFDRTLYLSEFDWGIPNPPKTDFQAINLLVFILGRSI